MSTRCSTATSWTPCATSCSATSPWPGTVNFSELRLLTRSNAELADNLGNLVNRRLRCWLCDGIVPLSKGDDEVDSALREGFPPPSALAVYKAMDDCDLMTAVTVFIKQCSALNLYVNDTQPWALAKQGSDDRLDAVLYHAVEGLRHLAILGYAFMPGSCSIILTALGESADATPAWSDLRWGGLPAGRQTSAPPYYPSSTPECWGSPRWIEPAGTGRGLPPRVGRRSCAGTGNPVHSTHAADHFRLPVGPSHADPLPVVVRPLGR